MPNYFTEVDLQSHHTFGLQAKARALFEFEQDSELQLFLNANIGQFDQYMPVGAGSNLLFINDFNGCILKSSDKTIEIDHENGNDVFIMSGAGVEWDDLVDWTVKNGLYGLENLSLIPGKVGAVPVQNIGAYGVEIKDVLHKAQGVNLENGKIDLFDHADCKFGYRDSAFKRELAGKYMFTKVWFKLQKNGMLNCSYGNVEKELNKLGKPTLENVRQAIINIRNSKLPDHTKIGNAGSFFKNPVIDSTKANELLKKHPHMPHYPAAEGKTKLAAGWLIDQQGWKGYVSDHGAGVHPHQALVLINQQAKNGKDIWELALEIQISVKNSFGVTLEPEVTIIK